MDLPKSGRNRLEEYLLYLCGKGAVYPLTPRNRLECFLDYLCKHAGGGGGGSVTVDAALSATSENPVQNKAVKAALDQKADSASLANKLDKAQGAANAGKFLVVGENGNVTLATLTAWQGGNY